MLFQVIYLVCFKDENCYCDPQIMIVVMQNLNVDIIQKINQEITWNTCVSSHVTEMRQGALIYKLYFWSFLTFF